jgi:ABC-type branched-subunit amino acid transport system permease subunit
MNILASGGFWAFVGVVAGIYTILTLGLQVQFGFAGLLNFGQVGFMAIGAYTMAILVVKEGLCSVCLLFDCAPTTSQS